MPVPSFVGVGIHTKHQNCFQLDLGLGAKEPLVLPLVALKHLQLVMHWLARKEQNKLE